MCPCLLFFFFSSRRRHTRCSRDWSSDVCSSDLFSGRAGAPSTAGKVRGEGHVIAHRDVQIRNGVRMTEGTDMHVRHTAVADARICRQADDALAVYLHDLRLVTEAVEQHLALAWSDGSEFLAVGGVGDDHQAAAASGTQGRLR